jgi:hypothetical protein
LRGPAAGPRPDAAPLLVRIARVLVAPLVLACAAVTGLAFVILLPVCGIASILEGLTRTAWCFAKDALRPIAAARRSRN